MLKRILLAALAAFCVAGCGTVPSSPPPPIPFYTSGPTQFGVDVHENRQVDDQELDLDQKAGFHLVRHGSEIEFVPPPVNGKWDLSLYHAFNDAFRARNMQPLWITSYGIQPINIPVYVAFYTQFASEMPGGWYEVFNEPNITKYWCNGEIPLDPPVPGCVANVKDYLALAIPVAQAIHKADPTAIVVTGGTSGIDVDWIKGLIAGGAFDKGNFDALAVHPYGQTTDTVYQAMYTVYEMLPKHVTIWSTEYGNSPINEDPTYGMTAMFDAMSAMGIPVHIHYMSMDETDYSAGLIDLNYQPKQPYYNDAAKINGVTLPQ